MGSFPEIPPEKKAAAKSRHRTLLFVVLAQCPAPSIKLVKKLIYQPGQPFGVAFG
jgi:hypothetical protein